MSAILPRTTPAQARTVAQRMHAALATPIALADHTFHVQASVGISAAGRPGMNTATLLQEADTAMYRAKKTRADTAVAARDWPLPALPPRPPGRPRPTTRMTAGARWRRRCS